MNAEILSIETAKKIQNLDNLEKQNKQLQQQCKKQKEVIDRIFNETKETRNKINNNRHDNILSKCYLLTYLANIEDILIEVSK